MSNDVITYFITDNMTKFPSFEWILGQVDAEEDKLCIFKTSTHSLHIRKSDYNKYWVILCLVTFTTERFMGEYNCYAANHLILQRYDGGETKTLADVESIFCDTNQGVDFDFEKLRL